MRTPRSVLLAAFALVACGGPVEPPPATAAGARAPAWRAAPAVVVRTAAGPVALVDHPGRPVVLLLAPPGDAVWAALDSVRADLESNGAVVLTEAVADGSEAADAFGYAGAPVAAVVDGEGRLRGTGRARSGDDLFALAAPVLAEVEIARTVSWRGADTLDDLLAAGGVAVDLGADGGPGRPPHALRLALSDLGPTALPADLGTPLAFLGADAAEGAGRAVSWGYVSVYVAEPSGTLRAVEAPPPPARLRQSSAVRG